MRFGQRELDLANEVVERTLAELPAEIAAAVGAVSVFVEAVPGREDLVSGVGADWLGIFEGAGHAELGRVDPPRIRIWARNVWEFSSGREARYRNEIRLTLLHEIGHFLGLDEDAVADRGLA